MSRNILKNKFFLSWALIHFVSIAAFLILLLGGTKFKINTGLFDILPDSSSTKEIKDAESILSSRTGRMFVILVKDTEFSAAKEKAVRLYVLLNEDKNKDCFESVDLFVDDNIYEEIASFYYRHRYHLLGEEEVELLSTNDGVEQFVAESQAQLFIGTTSSVNVIEDPFVLSEIAMQNTLSKMISTGTSMQVLGGVLSARFDDKEYVMIRGSLKPESVAITNKKSGVKIIKDCITQLNEEIKKDNGETEILVSGVPFHSYESSSSAQKEISIIATVSIVMIVLLCIYIFRNVVPVVFSVGAICISSLCAFCTVLVVFKEIHILTFVFGTTLIGTCLDYSIHYFVRWKADNGFTNGEEIRKHLLKGLTLSLVSTLISYILLLFTPFTLLKQISVFCAAGILSSYLSVIGFYPFMKIPKEKKEIKMIKILENFSYKFNEKLKIKILSGIILLIVVLLFVFRNNIRIDNNLKTMYSMKGELLENEQEVNKVLNSGSNGSYFIVKGTDAEDVLEKEERLCKKLDQINARYNCVSKYIPSVKKQKKSYESIEKIMPYAKEQYELISYEGIAAEQKGEHLLEKYRAAKEDYVVIDGWNVITDNENSKTDGDIPDFIKKAAGNFWLGKTGESFYTCVMPLHFNDKAMLKEISEIDDSFYYVDKTVEIGNELNKLTKVILILLCAAFVIMTVILKFFYKIKDTLKIMSIPLITAGACIAAMGFCKIPLGFFSVTGIVLVFGLSIDYIIYSVENISAENFLAVVLSVVTSFLSFGLLALSSFAPVFMFGFTVSVGLLVAAISTFFIKNSCMNS
ncbi:MAG: MMPL family transporter [Treponema sp.]|uniref:MMPL family transporter n=1 Tax=Treponema sp. TaxID=166 RepID=UPI00298E9FC4|nr:MMPL family transporter [Treponema sp.]MBR5933379.1 MMPL family transporter [Treponema sp.]